MTERPTHFLLGGRDAACGAESSWRRRIATRMYCTLVLTRDPIEVTCKNCRRSAAWMREPK